MIELEVAGQSFSRGVVEAQPTGEATPDQGDDKRGNLSGASQSRFPDDGYRDFPRICYQKNHGPFYLSVMRRIPVAAIALK